MNSEQPWRPLSEPPPLGGDNAVHINVRTPDGLTHSYRWLPYKKPQRPPYVGGRWQKATEYGWINNATLPAAGEWQPNPATRGDIAGVFHA